ncbi:hypothetical protein VM636_00800 [Streptomyces sp. SCSIO 75703]|uniref:hypothetical protein n=1 Tax=unclassified Streptomyces TaxID=2593676 RepID=UPI0004C01F51|nr:MULTISPECIES: hypothetical protein [unclassified Streptomyces]
MTTGSTATHHTGSLAARDDAPPSGATAAGTGTHPLPPPGPDPEGDAGPRDTAGPRTWRVPGADGARQAVRAVAALAACGVAHFPLHRHGMSVRAYAVVLALSALCLALALLLTGRPSGPLLGLAALLPAAPAAAGLYGNAHPSGSVARALELTLAPAWAASALAATASLTALAALWARTARPADRH